MTEQTMFSFSQLEKRYSVSKETLQRAAKRNDIRTVYLAGRRLVPLSEVERIDLVGFGPGRKSNKRAPVSSGASAAGASR
jgi:hypothetical protein